MRECGLNTTPLTMQQTISSIYASMVSVPRGKKVSRGDTAQGFPTTSAFEGVQSATCTYIQWCSTADCTAVCTVGCCCLRAFAGDQSFVSLQRKLQVLTASNRAASSMSPATPLKQSMYAIFIDLVATPGAMILG